MLDRRPTFTPSEAEALALEHYALSASASALPSERDQNFKLEGAQGSAFVLKLAHADESAELLGAQQQAFEKLAELPRKVFPRILPLTSGAAFLNVEGAAGRRHLMWLIPFLPGRPVAEVAAPPRALLRDIGQLLGQMDSVLREVRHPALKRTFQWAAQSAPGMIAGKLEHLRTNAQRRRVEAVLEAFGGAVTSRLPELRRSPVHNDVNDYNLLVSGNKVSAVLDFGDLLESYTVCDPAHACAYLMLDKPDPLEVALAVVQGYGSVYPLTETELYVLYDFVRLRLALSVTISAYQQALEPDNPYLSISERPAWRLLRRLGGLEAEASRQRFVALAQGPVNA